MSETEQTMEEILESIRKIVSDDSDDTITYKEDTDTPPTQTANKTKDKKDDKPAVKEEVVAPIAQQDDEEDVLELVDEVNEEDDPSTLVEESPAEPVDLAEPEDPEDIDVEPALESAAEFETSMPDMPDIDALENTYSHRIVSEETETLGTSAFASLERSIRMGNAGDSLEEIVRSILRPMLKSWLDEHLPQLVENLVQQEIERMSIGGRRRADDDT